MTRPTPLTEHQRAEIVRLWRLRRGRVRIARAIGATPDQVRREMERQGLTRTEPVDRPWTTAERDLLIRHIEDYGLARMARTLCRSVPAVRAELSRQQIPLTRLTLSVTQVARLTGRSEPTILRAIGRGELQAHKASDGAVWRVHGTHLRAWVEADPSRCDPRGVADWYELVWLLTGQWGSSDETARREERRRRARQTPPGGAGPPRGVG